MPDKTVALYTLGCRVNQYDTESLFTQLIGNGYSRVKSFSRADIHVINTCSVTKRADIKSRQLIRKVIRCDPWGRIVVIGCSVQHAPENFMNIKGVHLALGNVEKECLLKYLKRPYSGLHVSPIHMAKNVNYGSFCSFPEKCRANLKIQDGCDRFCSYCIIPFVRGASRSHNPYKIIDEAGRLISLGYREIVLTGIQIGQYSSSGWDLKKLLENLAGLSGEFRIRLSSVNPDDLNNEILDLILYHPKICRHLHISLQHGDNEVLRKMNRLYTRERVIETLDKIHVSDPYFGLGADIIVGFPGEGQKEFSNLYNFVQNLPLAYGHVFRYSQRRGTAASKIKDQNPEAVKIQRSLKIRKLLQKKKFDFFNNLIGTQHVLLVEYPRMRGYLSNYVQCRISSAQSYNVTSPSFFNITVKNAFSQYVEGEAFQL
ncbi:MAG: tRNA (N(6)-L-threonylcarbamoyladenosine(37)-C(2))-methylthiotransferase MtaB [Elusimicrobiota bacterium]